MDYAVQDLDLKKALNDSIQHQNYRHKITKTNVNIARYTDKVWQYYARTKPLEPVLQTAMENPQITKEKNTKGKA